LENYGARHASANFKALSRPPGSKLESENANVTLNCNRRGKMLWIPSCLEKIYPEVLICQFKVEKFENIKN